MSAVGILHQLARRLFVPWGSEPGDPSGDLACLSQLLRLPPETLLGFRSPRRPEARYHYRPFGLDERDGGRRQIFAPSPDLEALQRTLLHRYLGRQPVHPAATGFRRGLSVADDAAQHLGQELVVTADLEDFFDRTPARRVRAWFRGQGWDDEASAILTGLCTFRGALPQAGRGAMRMSAVGPISPLVRRANCVAPRRHRVVLALQTTR